MIQQIRVGLAGMALWLVTSCGVPLTTQGAQNPLLYDANEVAQAHTIAIFIPGALSSVDIFNASTDWADHGYARALYRYPGLDGLENDHFVNPARVAEVVANFANVHPDKDIALVGYSTGGPIALLAAPQISKGRKVQVAAMSTAVEHGGGIQTLWRGVVDVARAITATGSFQRQVVWKRFWSGLLYGPDALDDPAFADQIAADVKAGEQIIVRLDPAVALAHTLGLPTFALPEDLDLSDIPVAFFIGLNDRVFTTPQTQRFAAKVGGVPIYGYPDQGHLLFFTRPDVFDDMRAFLEGRDVR
ncbi:MAG: alpha/beta hydrolase [Pseudomonadota bacterium]